MVPMDGVLVAIVDVVDVVTVRHRFVPAVGAMRMVLDGVLGDGLMLVVVVLVGGVTMAVVQVVDMIVVPDRLMAAVLAMGVLGDGVFGGDMGIGAHDASFRVRFRSASDDAERGSRTCSKASEMTWETCRSAIS